MTRRQRSEARVAHTKAKAWTKQKTGPPPLSPLCPMLFAAYARRLAGVSQLTSFQNASMNLARALR